MENSVPLSAMLSQVLIAFVIEFDNEFERQTPHRTTNHGATGDPKKVPWLVSMPLWFRFLRFVPNDGIEVGELQRASGFSKPQMKIWLTRVSKWWRYVAVTPDGFVRPTAGGGKALAVWNGLNEVIEQRWAERFGRDHEHLRQILQEMEAKLAIRLPNSKYAERRDPFSSPLELRNSGESEMLPVVLGNLLFIFKTEYEQATQLSLPLCANLLRVLGDGERVKMADLPGVTGLSKEAIAALAKSAEKQEYARMRSDGRLRFLQSTNKGLEARAAYSKGTNETEERWRSTLGKSVLEKLRRSLERLTIATDGEEPAVFSRACWLSRRLACRAPCAQNSTSLSDYFPSRRFPGWKLIVKTTYTRVIHEPNPGGGEELLIGFDGSVSNRRSIGQYSHFSKLDRRIFKQRPRAALAKDRP